MNQPQQTPSHIAFERSGPTDNLPIVLIHAGIADRRMWDPQWDDLTSTRDTVRLDLRGFGESTTAPVTALSHPTDVIETLDHLGIGRCHLVGSSLGSGVVTEVALTRPGLAQSLLLCPPGGSLLAELTPDLQRFFDAERSALAKGDTDAAVEANISSWVVGPGRSESAVDPSVAAAVRDMQRNAFEIADTWGDVDETELDPPALNRLPDLTIPLLVLIGGHDLETTQDAARRVVAGAPNAQQVDWADVAHLPSMEKPEHFLTLLSEWVTAHD